jgi:hypothetical protein
VTETADEYDVLKTRTSEKNGLAAAPTGSDVTAGTVKVSARARRNPDATVKRTRQEIFFMIDVSLRARRDRNAFPLEHARHGTGDADDPDALAAEPLERPDAGPIDEGHAREVETQGGAGAKEAGTFALEQGGPLRGDFPLEHERRARTWCFPARDPQRHIGLLRLSA